MKFCSLAYPYTAFHDNCGLLCTLVAYIENNMDPDQTAPSEVFRNEQSQEMTDKEQVAQWETIAHLGTSMFGDTIIYDALRQVTLSLKQ